MTGTTAVRQSYLIGNYAPERLTLVRGEGSHAWDESGRRYLDFTTGIAVNALGHCHPAWVARVTEQARQLVHCSNVFTHPGQEALAERLCRLAGPGRVFFCNSGTEANEALLKLARLHGRATTGEEGRRTEVICAANAFHGRTFGSMSATPKEKVQGGFRPLLPGFRFGKLNDLASFEALVDDCVAAVFVESIQGEGGILPCEADFLQGLRELCDRHGMLLMIDEVQCGGGRTGRYFAFEYAGIKPDAIGMAKGLAGGFPLGAIWVREAYADLFQPGSHGTTFGGSPLACAAAHATLDVIEEEDLLTKVRTRAAAWRRELEALAEQFPRQVEEVRGLGYLLALGMREKPAAMVAALREHGLLAVPAEANAVRLLPPLTVSEEELAASVSSVHHALQTLEGNAVSNNP